MDLPRSSRERLRRSLEQAVDAIDEPRRHSRLRSELEDVLDDLRHEARRMDADAVEFLDAGVQLLLDRLSASGL